MCVCVCVCVLDKVSLWLGIFYENQFCFELIKVYLPLSPAGIKCECCGVSTHIIHVELLLSQSCWWDFICIAPETPRRHTSEQTPCSSGPCDLVSLILLQWCLIHRFRSCEHYMWGFRERKRNWKLCNFIMISKSKKKKIILKL